MTRLHVILVLLVASCLWGSCKVLTPNQMFKLPKDYEYVELDDFEPKEYRLRRGDRFTLTVLTNEGYRLVDAGLFGGFGQQQQQGGGGGQLQYQINAFGFARLPVIDSVYLDGYTITEAEDTLAGIYRQILKDPFVRLDVTTRRVFVFPGLGDGQVVILQDDNTTLIELLAQIGGINQRGKAYKIKLIRGDYTDPQISLIDMRTVEGMKQANLIVRADDIIVIDQTLTLNTTFIAEILPFLGYITTILGFYAVIVSLNNR